MTDTLSNRLIPLCTCVRGAIANYTRHTGEDYKHHFNCSPAVMNADSSRSHLVVSVLIESTNLTNGAVTRGKVRELLL